MRLLKIRENTGADLRGGNWPAEKVPLDLIAVECVKKRRLRRVFDAFDRYTHVHVFTTVRASWPQSSKPSIKLRSLGFSESV
jgi:hypothetical protein